MAKPNEHLVRAAQPFLSGQKETYATVLLAALMKAYGTECLNWDPLTIEAQVKDDFGVEMPGLVYNQLMALVSVLTNDSVYRLPEVFDQTVNALCRVDMPTDQDMPSPEELAWTVFEISANDPDPYGTGRNGDYPWSHDIALYCGVVLADAGIKRAPSTLEFAQMPGWQPRDQKDAPDEYQAAFASQDQMGQEIDQFVQKQFGQLVEHLKELGVEPAQPLLEQSEDLPEENPLDLLLPPGR